MREKSVHEHSLILTHLDQHIYGQANYNAWLWMLLPYRNLTICASKSGDFLFHNREQPLIVMATPSVSHQCHCPQAVGGQTPSMLHRFHSHYLCCKTRHWVMDHGPDRTSFGWCITSVSLWSVQVIIHSHRNNHKHSHGERQQIVPPQFKVPLMVSLIWANMNCPLWDTRMVVFYPVLLCTTIQEWWVDIYAEGKRLVTLHGHLIKDDRQN